MEQSYKEKYEQALERAGMSYHTGDYDRDTLEMLEIIFPELKKEGYSEAVRKVIIKLVKEKKNQSGLKGYGGLGWEDILAWLENIPYTIDHENREGFHLGYKACLERQGEQKTEKNKGNVGGISPNWSEEDEENFCSVYLDVKSARQNTVNSLSGELKEQEQKRMDEVISWLRTLKGRVLPKQEWNEEDEQHIDSLLKRLDALCRNKFERTRFAISEDRDWLKSLRPQNRWKPSDEQMMALLYHCSNGSVLTSLYNDLNKLKEE